MDHRGLVAIELIYFDRITVNRPAITAHELEKTNRLQRRNVDAVRDIKANDNSFFGSPKQGIGGRHTTGFNDAMVFGYYGTTSYSTYNNLDYIRFLMAIDAIKPRQRARRSAKLARLVLLSPAVDLCLRKICHH